MVKGRRYWLEASIYYCMMTNDVRLQVVEVASFQLEQTLWMA